MTSLHQIDAEISALIDKERCDSILRNLPTSLFINSLLAISAAALIYDFEHSDAVLIWAGLVLCFNVIRYVVAFLLPETCWQETVSSSRLRISAACSLISGILWTAVPIVFLDYSSYQTAYVSIILCGLTAGAAVQGTSYAPPVIALALPILGSMIVTVGLSGTPHGYILMFDLILYLAVIIRSSIVSGRSFASSVIVRHEARDLAERLKVEHAASQAAAARFYQLANHDPLTGAANRALFTKTLSAWLSPAERGDRTFRLFLIDLDHFKSINDTLGHSAGDDVLREVARRLSGGVSDDRFIARLGGDEFALLMRSQDGDLDDLADGILKAGSGPLDVEGRSVDVGLSIGLARYPNDGANAEELMARADLALYAAKDKGRGRWEAFDPSMLQVAEIDRDIERDLPAALAGGDLEIWWQPQVDIDRGRLTGLEGLLRWRHPIHGWVSPPLIVATALRTRRSEALTGFVIGRACAMIAHLAAMGRDDMVVAINISPSEILKYDLPALVRRSIEAAGIDPSRLELEITEEAVLSNEAAIMALKAVAQSGVRLAIDDFGTGCSSFSYLRTLRARQIKIDRSFVTGLREREEDRRLVQAIVGLGRSLGIQVVAEGVETVDDVLVLRRLGCRIAQGYHYGAALPEAELQAMLDADTQIDTGAQPALTGQIAGRR